MLRYLRHHSAAPDPAAAVWELAAHLDADASLTVFFVSERYDLDLVATLMAKAFPGPMLGCAARGLIAPGGYHDEGIVGATISSSRLSAETHVLDLSDIEGEVRLLAEGLAAAREEAFADPVTRRVGVLLVDGLSFAEERLMAALGQHLPWLEVVGASASGRCGRGMAVYTGGRLRTGIATLTLLRSSLPMTVVKLQHHVAGDRRVVVTRADPARRLVHEIDGFPAVTGYARAVGCEPDALDQAVAASHPMIVRQAGVDYIRSVMALRADGAMELACSIDEGAVLRVGKAVAPVEGLRSGLDAYCGATPNPGAVLAFDCVLRRVELERRDLLAGAGAVFDAYGATGLSTYGEQCHGLHMNQTLTGLIIGSEAG